MYVEKYVYNIYFTILEIPGTTVMKNGSYIDEKLQNTWKEEITSYVIIETR
jgi:hypothetical protein